MSRASAISLLKGVHTHPARKTKPETIEERLAEIGAQDAEQNMALRRHLAYGALGAVALQLLASNVAFMAYGKTLLWEIDPEVMIAWLAASVLEVVAILAIIARNLFPNGSS